MAVHCVWNFLVVVGLLAGAASPSRHAHAGVSVDSSDTAVMSHTMTSAAPARDGNIAIREEYDAALRRHTRSALELFIARHPEHPLSVEARQYLETCFKEDNSVPGKCQSQN